MKQFVSLAVNAPYPFFQDVALPEGAVFDIRDGHASLEFFLSDITATEIADCRKGKSEFALTYLDGIIFLLCRFGNLSWSDAPFSIHNIPKEHQKLPDLPTPESRLILSFFVVEKRNRHLKVMKQISFSPGFSRAFFDCVHHQLINDNAQNYKIKLNGIYEKYTSLDLLKISSARCTGGD